MAWRIAMGVLVGSLVAAPAVAEGFGLPVTPACISSTFGERPAAGPRASRFHTGLDLPAPAGAWVRAAAAGRVAAIRRIGAGGLEVEIRHGEGLATRYAHLGTVAPALAGGRREVVAGEAIGRVGRTGITYGTHLHFEVWVRGERVDPGPYLPGVLPCGRRP
ncbi:M23 family metallopeptidase [Roseomonas sp. CCTCC AB2023176]|uniref:M23 family metallopeptidase n=1 Tax=Roseomonas sp. CCTCC AB2023176 TaxID=3342640 RepID=UPI0035DBA25C